MSFNRYLIFDDNLSFTNWRDRKISGRKLWSYEEKISNRYSLDPVGSNPLVGHTCVIVANAVCVVVLVMAFDLSLVELFASRTI